jgi:hypothetical protein
MPCFSLPTLSFICNTRARLYPILLLAFLPQEATPTPFALQYIVSPNHYPPECHFFKFAVQGLGMYARRAPAQIGTGMFGTPFFSPIPAITITIIIRIFLINSDRKT